MESEIIQLGGPHYKVCECGCNIEFYGRRNQKYYPKHKAKVNNEKRALRQEPLSKIISKMENNYRILLKYYPKSRGTAISYSPLLKEGFDPNAPCEMRKAVDTGIEYRLLINYYFRQTEDNKQIIINKINNGNTNK